MAGFHELYVATIALGRADVGAGSLTVLTGQTRPIVRWGDPVERAIPRIAVRFIDAPRRRGIPDGWDVLGQFDILVPKESDGLESTLADRLEVVLTCKAFKTKSVNTTARERRRSDTTELAEAGEVRLTVDYEFRLAKA